MTLFLVPMASKALNRGRNKQSAITVNETKVPLHWSAPRVGECGDRKKSGPPAKKESFKRKGPPSHPKRQRQHVTPYAHPSFHASTFGLFASPLFDAKENKRKAAMSNEEVTPPNETLVQELKTLLTQIFRTIDKMPAILFTAQTDHCQH